MRVTERVGGARVWRLLGLVYSHLRTLRTAVEKTVDALMAPRKMSAPGWVRSRISRRSLGRSKVLEVVEEEEEEVEVEVGLSAWRFVRMGTGEGVGAVEAVEDGASTW
jgi:hypothetical protein